MTWTRQQQTQNKQDKTETFIIQGSFFSAANKSVILQIHHNYLILHWKIVHTDGNWQIDITTLHVTDIIPREAFCYCRFTRVRFVKLRLIFSGIFGVVMLFLYDDSSSDYDETKKDSDCHRDDEI